MGFPVIGRWPERRLQPLSSNIPGAFVAVFGCVLALSLSVPFLCLSNAGAPASAEPPPPDPPSQIETRIQTDGLDRPRHALPFTIYILSHELSWKLQSVSDLEGSQPLLNPELSAALNQAREVFCIGTASHEGATRKEEARAAARAQTLANWIEPVIQSPERLRVFRLNAGQYNGPPELESSLQRKAVLMIAGDHSDEVNLSEALESGLRKKQQDYPIVYSLLHQYSRSRQWLRQLSAADRPGSRRLARKE